MAENTTWIDVTVKAVTPSAALLDNGHREAWVPRSQIIDSEDDLTAGADTKVELPVWLAEDKGLV